MSQIDARELERIINEHGEKIATLEALVVGLLKHTRDTQGAEAMTAAINGAVEEARSLRPADSPRASAAQLQYLQKSLLRGL